MSRSVRRFTKLTVLHLDADLVVVDKPAGVPAAGGGSKETTLIDLLAELPELADEGPVRVVHRLDKDASGVIAYARTLPAQQQLVRQFMDRAVEKVYIAIVSGYVTQDGEIDLPLAFDPRVGRGRVSTSRGKPALTRYRVIQRLAGNTLLECRPLTGRTHQIRIHLSAIEHPLTIDPLYGGGREVLLSAHKPGYQPSQRRAERPLIDRLTLHAAQLTFDHPTRSERMTLSAPLAKDMRITIDQLARLVSRAGSRPKR
jgi:23S rRNA pseudouridine1911/1915/1917 synthase